MRTIIAVLLLIVAVEGIAPAPALPAELSQLAPPPTPPVSYPPLPGTFRIRSRGNGRYLHERGINLLDQREVRSQLLINYDRLISTRYNTAETNTWTHFRFYPTANTGYYNIRVVASDRYINEDASGDMKISTRTQVMDDDAQFKFIEYCDGTVMIYAKGSSKFLRADTNTDDIVSTRYQVSSAAGDPLTRFVIEPVDVTQNLPAGFADMEIEAKWGITLSTMTSMIAGFPDNGVYTVPGGQTYTLNVRWDSRSRKYFDEYYDDATDTLASDKHSYRVRSRSVSSPLAANNNWDTLAAANWNFQWTKVQYKSTPIRLDAVWFRKETGNCKIAGGNPSSTCAVTDLPTILGGSVLHPANTAVTDDHPGFNFAMTKKTEVEDYRYRIELYAPGQSDPSFEVSLDQLETRSHSDGFTASPRTYEAELEILNTPVTASDVQELFRIVKKMEGDYNLSAKKKSKGGIPLDNAFIPGDSGTCLQVPIVAAPLPFEKL